MGLMRLVSVNIEGDRHLSTVLPFVAHTDPEVLCLQEVFEDHLAYFSTYPFRAFLAATIRRTFTTPQRGVFGIALVSKYPFVKSSRWYLRDYHGDLCEFDDTSATTIYATYRYGVISADIQATDLFRIATTHFTWTPNGLPTLEQSQDLTQLKTCLNAYGAHILVGDLNIPRGKNSLYERLATGYVDAIPSSYTGSIDVERHRLAHTTHAQHLETNMVDYIFTTPQYRAENVRLEGGVSDHKAIVAEIYRTERD